MQPKNSIPTRLFETEERRPVRIVPVSRPGHFRALRIAGYVLWIAKDVLQAILLRHFTGRDHTQAVALNVRILLERLGGLWIKAGQLLSMRRDLFPEFFCAELSLLQDSAFGFPESAVRAIVSGELGVTLEEVFSEFDPHPIAAASIGQVHRARLRRNGVEVAVKIQRPHIATIMSRDLRYARWFVRALNRLSIAPHGRWLEMIWELENIMRHEVDYRVEASFIQRMRKVLSAHKVYVPKVFDDESSQRVLVMEYIRGVFMTEFIRARQTNPVRLRAWLTENRIDPTKAGRRLYNTHTRQVFEDNLFHCDLHPGNIVLLRDSRLAFIDFGSVGSIDRTQLKKYYLIFQAIAQGDYTKAAEVFLLIGPPLRPVKVEDVKADIVRTLREWEVRVAIEDLPYHERSLTRAMQGIANVYRRHRIALGWEFLQVNRAEVTMDASLMYLLPQINYHTMIRRYERAARLRDVRRSVAQPSIIRRMVGLLAVLDVSPTLAENAFFEGERLRRRITNFDTHTSVSGLVVETTAVLLARLALGAAVVVVLMLINQIYPSALGGVVEEVMRNAVPWMAGTGIALRLLVLAVILGVYATLRYFTQRIRELSVVPFR